MKKQIIGLKSHSLFLKLKPDKWANVIKKFQLCANQCLTACRAAVQSTLQSVTEHGAIKKKLNMKCYRELQLRKLNQNDAILKNNLLNGYNFKGLCIVQQISAKGFKVNI